MWAVGLYTIFVHEWGSDTTYDMYNHACMYVVLRVMHFSALMFYIIIVHVRTIGMCTILHLYILIALPAQCDLAPCCTGHSSST